MTGTLADRLDVVDRGRAAPEAELRRERRLHARIAALALERIHQRRFLAADVRAGTAVEIEIRAEPGSEDVLPEVPLRVGIVDRLLDQIDPLLVLAADVEVRGRDRPSRSRR